jgi:hypothetical protein
MNRIAHTLSVVLFAASVGSIVGCEEKNKPAAPVKTAGAPTGAAKPDAHDHEHAKGDKHDHADGEKHDHDDHGHGDAAELGTATVSGFTVKVMQEGEIAEGKDAAFEISVTGGSAKPSAVRAWIGAENAQGSVKGKAEVEGDGYHLHVEVPKPIPAAAKLWVEIEGDRGTKVVTSFALKM